MTSPFETRLLELAADILTAVGRGELPADAAVVRAAGAALGELRRVPEPSPAPAAVVGELSVGTAGGGARAVELDGAGAWGRGAAPAIDQVLGVAARMRRERQTFAAACAAEAGAVGSSAQAVRNACTRWLGVAAADWQPLMIAGAEAGVLALARRAAARSPWLHGRIAEAFGVPARALAPDEGRTAAG